MFKRGIDKDNVNSEIINYNGNVEHVFSKKYQDRKSEILKNAKLLEENGTVKTSKKIKISAIVVACIILVPTIAVAGNRIRMYNVEKTDNYQTKITFEKTSDFDGCIDLAFNYIPEGLNEKDYGTFYDSTSQNGIICLLYGNIMENDEALINYTSEIDEFNVNEKNCYYVNREQGADHVYCYLEKYNHLLFLFVNNVDRTEVIKFIENISIEENDSKEKHYCMDVLNLQNDYSVQCSKEAEVYQYNEVTNIAHIEDEYIEGKVSDYLGYVSYKIKDVKVTDNVKDYDKKYFGIGDFADVIGEDGSIPDNIRYEINPGDGIKTLDECVNEEIVKQKMLFVTYDITNNSINNEVFYGYRIEFFDVTDDKIQRSDSIDSSVYKLKENYECYDWQPIYADTYNMTILTQRSYFIEIPKGETKTVTVGYLVPEDKLDEVFLVMGSGVTKMETEELSSIENKVMLYDIRQE